MSDNSAVKCSIDECDRRAVARGWCNLHYYRWKRQGDPQRVERIVGDSERRFWSKVDKSAECWLWIGERDRAGYGAIRWRGRMAKAHRVALELAGRDIPQGLEPDHLCRNRACVRSDHLELVTHRVNTLRGETLAARCAAVTECPQGHAYTAQNTYLYQGRRYCRQCQVDRRARRRLAA